MNWSKLNPDILCLIAKKLDDISNFVRFRVVCKHWRSVVPPSELPPQLPWFIEMDNWGAASSEIKFYSLHSGKAHTLHVPDVDGMIPLGSSNKFLFLTDLSCMTSILINPFTRAPVQEWRRSTRPHRLTLRSQIRVPYQRDLFLLFFVGQSRNHGSNSENNTCAAMLMTEYIPDDDKGKFFLCLCQSNDRVWMEVEVEMCYDDRATIYEENLFIHDKFTTDTRVIGDVVSVISGHGIHFDYLIQAFEDLLGVVRLFDNSDSTIAIEECRFKVYRLVQGGKAPSWAEMCQGIGDHMLFMDRHGAFCLKSSDFDGCKGNKILFSKWIKKFHEYDAAGFVLCLYGLEENKTQMLIQQREHELANGGIWFVLSLC